MNHPPSAPEGKDSPESPEDGVVDQGSIPVCIRGWACSRILTESRNRLLQILRSKKALKEIERKELAEIVDAYYEPFIRYYTAHPDQGFSLPRWEPTDD